MAGKLKIFFQIPILKIVEPFPDLRLPHPPRIREFDRREQPCCCSALNEFVDKYYVCCVVVMLVLNYMSFTLKTSPGNSKIRKSTNEIIIPIFWTNNYP